VLILTNRLDAEILVGGVLIMKLMAIIISIFFITAGTALAQLYNYDWVDPYERAYLGERGVPEQNSIPGQMPAHNRYEFSGMHSADDLIGRTVVSSDGEELGRIENLLFAETGQIEYIVFSRGGGIWRLGGNLVPVPWEAANLQVDQGDRLRADLTRRQFESAPTLVGGQEQITSPQYGQRVHGYYGTEPQTRR
jgi:sporulation protein YlmC with PRC-barrel domain